MITIDGEWGLGMRLDSVTKFPYQLTLGAINDAELVYKMGVAVGKQCKRMGVHVNYAPVVDINNNPNNPVIGYRSFGEDKNKVAEYGSGLYERNAGCRYHGLCQTFSRSWGCRCGFTPGPAGDQQNQWQQLETLELVPFKAMIQSRCRKCDDCPFIYSGN